MSTSRLWAVLFSGSLMFTLTACGDDDGGSGDGTGTGTDTGTQTGDGGTQTGDDGGTQTGDDGGTDTGTDGPDYDPEDAYADCSDGSSCPTGLQPVAVDPNDASMGCYCAPPCESANSTSNCPDHPDGGTASPWCADVSGSGDLRCLLICGDSPTPPSGTCVTGMCCNEAAIMDEGFGACFYPEDSCGGGGTGTDTDTDTDTDTTTTTTTTTTG